MFAVMKPRTLVAVVAILTTAAALAPLSIVVEYTQGQQQIQDRADALHAKQMKSLDESGDNDGFGEHDTLSDNTTISEISIYWNCKTMGNRMCRPVDTK